MDEDYEEYLDAIIQYRKDHFKKANNNRISFIRTHWPAIIASVLFGALMTVAVELVVRNWELVKGTF